MKFDMIDIVYYELSESGDLPNDWSGYDVLEDLLKPLELDYDTRGTIMDQVMNITSEDHHRGFRAGFRMGARMILDCFPERENGKKDTQ